MIKEVWKDIKGYEGIYQVSNIGNIKSLEREVPNKRFPGVTNILKEKRLKPGLSSSKYMTVVLSDGIKIKTFSLHRLIACAFIENNENKPYINHKDGDKLNNIFSNLEWCTASENGKHAHKLGLNSISEYTKFKIKEANSKKVIDKDTGEIYNSVITAAKSIKMDKSYLAHMLNGKYVNKTNLIFLK
jgi:hypothetical protein